MNGEAWRDIAVSADCTLLDLHKVILGAFGVRRASRYAFDVAGAAYIHPKGSRTPLRRILDEGVTCVCIDGFAQPERYDIEVTSRETVRSRRHYPKVFDGAGEVRGGRAFDSMLSQWDAQGMMRDEVMLQPESDAVRLAIVIRDINPDSMLADREAAIHGFLACMVVGPLLMPSAWVPVLFGDAVWPSQDTASAAIALAMKTYNAVVDEFREGSTQARLDREWCEGFMFGVVLNGDEWKEAISRNPSLHAAMRPIVECAQGAQTPARAVFNAAHDIREWWREHVRYDANEPFRRTERKMQPNEPCSCGSGKKYKKCCSPLRAV